MAISIQLVIILTLFAVISLIRREQTIWKILLAFLILVPSSAQGLISGTSYSTAGVLNLSLVGYGTLIAGFLLMFRHRILEKKTTVAVLGCFWIILIVRVVADGMNFISNKLFDNYLLPMFLAVIIVSYIKPQDIPSLLKLIYYLILIGAVIACVEYVNGRSLLFHQYYMDTCPWYETIYISAQYVAFRSCSYFGHPLIGAIYYLVGVVYLLNVQSTQKKSKVLFGLQFAILTLALLSTNARAALMGLAVYVVYYLFKKKKIGKLVALLCVALSMMVFVDWKSLYYVLFARDSNGSSFMVRVNAILSLINIPARSIILGEGYNNTSSLLKSLGFIGNVEISYLIILMENGIIGFIAWMISIFHFFNIRPKAGSYSNTIFAIHGMLAMIFIVGGMSNSFGDPGTLNYLIYILLAFNYVIAKTSNEEKIIA